jgi:hypothetical protein
MLTSAFGGLSKAGFVNRVSRHTHDVNEMVLGQTLKNGFVDMRELQTAILIAKSLPKR